MSDEWKKLNRELKILLAKHAAGGFLHPKDKQRLEWLQERLGAADEVKRLHVDDSEEAGPKITTSEDHYATEMSEELLRQAEQQKLEKKWEQENIDKQQRAFEARDAREGKETFKQEGLSTFAIEAAEDMREGELGLAEVPQEEEESAQKMDLHRPVYAQDESERLTKKPAEGKKANPFALELSDGLARGLEDHKTFDSAVPDIGGKALEVDMGEDDPLDSQDTVAIEEVSEEVQVLLRKSYDLPKEGKEAQSFGERTSFEVEDTDKEEVNPDLLLQAVEYAEERGLVEQEQTWAVDEDGNEVIVQPDTDDLVTAATAPDVVPLPAQSKPRPRFSDGPGTEPFMPVTENPTDTKEFDVSLLDAANQAEESIGNPSGGTLIPDPPEPAILIPDPPEPTVTEEAGALIPDPPDMSSDEDSGMLIPDPPEPAANEEPEVLIPEPPQPSAGGDLDLPATDFSHESTYEPEPEVEIDVPDLSDDEELEVAIEIEPETTVPEPPRPSPPPTQPKASEADQFWGLSDDSPAPEPEFEDPTSAQSPRSKPKSPPPPPPPPAPKKKAASRPLPALSFTPDAVQPAKPEPKQKVRSLIPNDIGPDISGATGATEGSFLNDLFDEKSSAGHSDGMIPVAPASPARNTETIRTGPAFSGSRPGAATHGKANDLSGPRRATVHFKDGVNRRGVLNNVDTSADLIRLEPAPGDNTPAEDLVALSLKAIFLLLPRGAAYPVKSGMETRITMIDGRALEGFTPDYDPQRNAFTLFPKADRGNIERVIVFNDAVKNIWFQD